MLIKPNKYDDIQVNVDFEKIELGGHKGIIKNVEQYASSISGKKSLKVELDTDKTDKQPNYYQKQYDENTDMNKKWASAGTKYIPLGEEENQIKMLKAFITAVENSNKDFKFDWNKEEKEQLINKKIGLVIGIEEYEDSEGKNKNANKIVQLRSLDKVENISIPKVKLLDGTFVDYDNYIEHKEEKTVSPETDMVEIDSSFLD